MSFLPHNSKNNKDKVQNKKIKTPTARENNHKSSYSNKFYSSKNNQSSRELKVSNNNFSKTERKTCKSKSYINKSKSKSKPKSKMTTVIYQGKGIDLNMVCGSSHPINKFAQSAISFHDNKNIIPDEGNTFSIRLTTNNNNPNAEYNKNYDNQNSNLNYNYNYQLTTTTNIENKMPTQDNYNKTNLNQYLSVNSNIPKENQRMSYKINDNNTLYQKDFYNNQNEINPILNKNKLQNENIITTENNFLPTEESKENQIQKPNSINRLNKLKENINSLNDKFASKPLISSNINNNLNNPSFNNFSNKKNNYINNYNPVNNNRNIDHTNYINDKLKNIMNDLEKKDKVQKTEKQANIFTISQRYRPVTTYESYNFNKILNNTELKKSIFNNTEPNEKLLYNKYDDIFNNFSTKNWGSKSKINYYNCTANNFFKITNTSRLDELLKKVPRHNKNEYRNSFGILSPFGKIKENNSTFNTSVFRRNQTSEKNKQIFDEELSVMPANGFINRQVNKLISEKIN